MALKEPEVFGGGEAPTPLATLGDVQRALAKTLRRIEAGTVKHDTGQVLINGYGCLAKVMQDRRDSVWTQRARQMWNEREAAKSNGADAQANH